MRIDNDKYYTPINIANLCWEEVLTVIDKVTISSIIEPSVGDGAFLHYDIKPSLAFDIAPECASTESTKVVTGDFLTQEIEYKAGRLIIGNPPFGCHMNMAQKFYKKAVQIADYVAFILPISQLNNTSSLYEFDLIKSIDLGLVEFTDRDLHCCFNIYCRPQSGALNQRKVKKLRDVSIYRQDKVGYSDLDYDIRMCYWGDGSAGKILKPDEHYSAEYKIKIHNEELKARIIEVITTCDWKERLDCIASRKIQQFMIIDLLKESINEIQ
jgi:hypothetical protein